MRLGARALTSDVSRDEKMLAAISALQFIELLGAS
jgi:hypothetical protein